MKCMYIQPYSTANICTYPIALWQFSTLVGQEWLIIYITTNNNLISDIENADRNKFENSSPNSFSVVLKRVVWILPLQIKKHFGNVRYYPVLFCSRCDCYLYPIPTELYPNPDACPSSVSLFAKTEHYLL